MAIMYKCRFLSFVRAAECLCRMSPCELARFVPIGSSEILVVPLSDMAKKLS